MNMTAGTLVLEGGAEFGGQMEEPDRRALALAGGPEAPVWILPTAAAPDHNHRRAGNEGKRWFIGLGASRVEAAGVIDRASANLPENADRLRQAKLIYLLGGFPQFLAQTLAGSAVWNACLKAYGDGAVIAGSSAGAMVLCEHYYDPQTGQVEPGLGLVPGTCLIPHHDRFGEDWAGRLRMLLPQAVLLGVDERTGMVAEDLDAVQGGPERAWCVYGQGKVTLYLPGDEIRIYQRGENFQWANRFK
jgi:cyanophycinase